MTTPRLAAFEALVAAAALVAGGCGGGATPTASLLPAPTATATPGAEATAGATRAAESPRSGATASPPRDGAYYVFTPSADGQDADLQAGFRAAIGDLGGVAAASSAGPEPSSVVDLVRGAIAQGAVGIAVAASDAAVGPDLAQAAAGAGVPLVAAGVPLADAGGTPVPLVAFDDVAVGGLAGAAAARLMSEYRWNPKKVGVLSAEVQTRAACVARASGAREGLRNAGVRDGQVFAVVYGGGTASAADAAAAVIAAHPDIVRWVVVGCDDEGVRGVLDALVTFRVTTDNVVGVGIGGYLACVPWAARQPSGFRAAVLLAGREIGRAAALALEAHIQSGVPLSDRIAVPAPVVGPADLAVVEESYPCR